jgi:F-type H+-transporting ATPase subunit alpha
VGGSAQVKSMKKLSGSMKLELAQFRELEAFAKFGSDLDASTQRQLSRGARAVEVLKQGLYSPLSVDKQIAILLVNNKGLLDGLAVNQIAAFETEFLNLISLKFSNELSALLKSGVLSDDLSAKLIAEAEKVISQLNTK